MSTLVRIQLPPPSQMKKIGAIFTPLKWAKIFAQKHNITKKWLQGATVFDPTMGEGNLIQAIIEQAIKSNPNEKLPIHNLYGCEMNKNFYANSFKIIQKKYDIKLPKRNFYHSDILDLQITKKFDVIFSNPPWNNFSDLPTAYKEKIKPQFFKYNLATNKKNLLWGNARIDIAALIIQKTITDFLKPQGQGFYFTPLSILFNDGAHEGFRQFQNFCIDNIYDFNNEPVFENIGTRYGFISLTKNKKQKLPITSYLYEKSKWQKTYAHSRKTSDALFLYENKKPPVLIKKIAVAKASQPRQGINTAGANHIFFFDELETKDKDLIQVSNKKLTAILPKKYLYPVLTPDNFANKKTEARWVFLPYDKFGKPLAKDVLQKDKLVWNYLKSHKATLQARKGVIINTMIRRDLWWGLLGVGIYNFASYKIAWEAYGRCDFTPRIFTGRWQANQSLQAFMPFDDKKVAERILLKLQNKGIEKHLLSFGGGGTMSWAQPGRIKQFLELIDR